MQLDAKKGNKKWKEAVNTELSQIVEYETFEDKGKGAKVPKDIKLIQCHFVFDVKHDGSHKARYAVIFLAELNGLQLYAADVGNAYLEAKTPSSGTLA